MIAECQQHFLINLSELTTKLVLYYLTPIYVIGILGNIFNVIIFLRRTLRTTTCSQYFIGMSIAQIILCNSSALTKIITYTTGYDSTRTVSVLCKGRIYIYVFGLGLMRQFLCLISIDRWIVTTRNARIRKLSSLYIVRWLIFGSTLFWILYSIHALIGYQISPTRGCAAPLGSDYALFYAIQLTVSSIIPIIIMIVFSVFTMRNVRSGQRRIQVAAQNNAIATAVASALPQGINRRRREMHLIKLSILQVIFYVLFNMLSACYVLYSVLTSSQTKASDQTAIEAFLGNISIILVSTYSAITFVLYTLASKTFRKEFLLTCSQAFKHIQRLVNN